MICSSCGAEIPKDSKFCGQCGVALALDSEAIEDAQPLERQVADRRQLSILFCDLVGATGLAEQLDPEDWRALIREYQGLCSGVVARYDGYVAQYLGDGILIYFGFPTAHEDGAYRSVRSALDILEGMAELNSRLERRGGSRLDLRIGIHTGLVVVETMGTGDGQPLALGDTPNIAARIQEFAPLNRVVISATTQRLVSSRFELIDQGERILKGIRKPVHLFAVERERPLLSEPRTSPEGTPFVGRSAELQQLLDLWGRALAGQGQLVLLAGEAGVGKSRLAGAFRKRIREQTPAAESYYRCLFHFRQSALRPFIDSLRWELDIGDSEPASIQLQKLEGGLSPLGRRGGEVKPLLASLLSLPADTRHIPPSERGERLHEALTLWLVDRFDDRPGLIVMEDLHWADTSTVQVLSQAASRLREKKILLIATCRDEFELPEFAPEMDHIRTVRLGRLKDSESEQMIRARAAGTALPAGLIDRLIERAGGVPLFVEELTRTVMELEKLGGTKEQNMAARASTAGIPDTLQDTLMARIDRLGSLKFIAQVAATLGREFEFSLLSEVSSLDPAELRRNLEQLLAAEVILSRDARSETYYVFAHALLQEAAYGSLLKGTRRALHRKVAEALEARAETAVETGKAARGDFVERLAFHWQRAVVIGEEEESLVLKVSTYMREAAERTLALSAYREAAALLREALRLLEPLRRTRERDELELTIQARLCTALKVTAWGSTEFKSACDRARALCVALGNRAELAPILFQLWWHHLTNAEYTASLDLAREAHKLAQDVADTDLEMEALGALANSRFWLGSLSEALGNAKRVLELYDPELHFDHLLQFGQDPRMLALQYTVWIPCITGRLDVAMDRHAEMERLVVELEHPFSTSMALCTSSLFHLCCREVELTLASAEEFLELARKHGFDAWIVVASMFRYWALALQGNAAEVIDEAKEIAQSRWETLVGYWGQSFVRLVVAEILASGGYLLEALDLTDAGLDAVSRYSEPTFEAELLRFKGDTLAALPDRQSEAEATLRRAVDVAVDRGTFTFALRAAASLMRLMRSTGKPLEECRALLEEQHERFKEGSDSRDLREARRLLAAVSV